MSTQTTKNRMNSRSSGTLIIRIALIILGIAVALFITSRILPYAQGPYLQEISLEDQQFHDEHWIVIEGVARNAETVSVNTVTVPLAEDGSFTHPRALNPGVNTIFITVSNGFETIKEYSYKIITPPLDEFYIPLYNEAMDTESEHETDTDPQEILLKSPNE